LTGSIDLSPIELIEVTQDGRLVWPGGAIRCALGRSGVTRDKREGDGATPAGLFPLRALWYREDRVGRPPTALARFRILPEDGWCDDPADPAYNRPVKLPYPGRHERLHRADGLYDLVVPLGYNDDPIVPGRGSAIFLHVCRPDYGPTEGCVAIPCDDLLPLVARCGPQTRIRIRL
jgi:L,D-peptidoglycan transpeptidase YkuD (ErfK/YbiS/YcfS/YnhG family)